MLLSSNPQLFEISRQMIVDFTEAMRVKDIEKIMSYYAPDLVAFDIMPPLRFVGRDQYRKSWETGFNMMQGPWNFEQQNLNIQVSGDLAFCHALNHAAGKLNDGETTDGWMRWTCCLRKINGNWKIVHEHNSVPIDIESDKAMWNLKP
jgi:ketosteroid isomerase-like protein